MSIKISLPFMLNNIEENFLSQTYSFRQNLYQYIKRIYLKLNCATSPSMKECPDAL